MGCILGISLFPYCPSISHLFSTYDSLVFCKAKITELYVIKDLLLKYDKTYGQKINFDKSAVWFSSNVNENCQNYL